MRTPMATGLKLHKDSSGTPVECKLYRGMIGSLLYLTASRPDIMFSTCIWARFQANPKESHLSAVKRILRYLKKTPSLGLWYPLNSGFDLLAYTDSDYGGCQVDRKSTYGRGKLINWSSKKQNCVSTSTAEAEYVATASYCSQALWMQTQLKDYGYTFGKIPILCDSKSAIAISANPVQHSKTKYIDIRYHFLKSHVEEGNLADLFKKALDEKRFNFLAEKIGMTGPVQVNPRTYRRGSVNLRPLPELPHSFVLIWCEWSEDKGYITRACQNPEAHVINRAVSRITCRHIIGY
ncbi:hypothetical protein OSB04_024444 [Centaurea solstitialis]|uniref:Copia protein n=1 Tax=Centaurea solstitialis TaxID=347529 RepID=A0AA38T4L2_9ASTR|nr:hypothetical protein OSB04_024444 [Centaurea solstitialis]